jgi:peroxiredoxin
MGLKINEPLPAPLLETEVLDKNGKGIQFKDVLNADCSLVILIRHFACIGCTEQMLAIAPKIEEIENLHVSIKIIGNGAPMFIEGFIEKFKLGNKAVEIYTDPSLKIYEEANMVRSFWRIYNPKTIVEYLKAWRKGIGQKSVKGDNLQLGGTFLVNSASILEYYFQNKSVAGIADPNELMKAVHKHVLRKNVDLI